VVTHIFSLRATITSKGQITILRKFVIGLTYHLAGGGLRQSLKPDFLIGAHALIDCDAPIAFDRGCLRTMFK